METEELILNNLKLVDYCIHRYFHIYITNPEYEDYQQEGRVGLILAAQRFDKNTGYQFNTFAMSYIYGYLIKYRNENSFTNVKISRTIKEKIATFVALTNAEKSKNEILQELNISEKEYCIYTQILYPESLNQEIKLEDATTLGEMIGFKDTHFDQIEIDMIFQELLEKSLCIFKQEKHRQIWKEYFTRYYQGDKCTGKELSQKYNLSESNTRKVIQKGKEKLLFLGKYYFDSCIKN